MCLSTVILIKLCSLVIFNLEVFVTLFFIVATSEMGDLGNGRELTRLDKDKNLHNNLNFYLDIT